MLSESGLRGDETNLIGGSRIFGVRCVFASLFGEARFCTALEINPGAVVALGTAHNWECSAKDSGLYGVF